MMKLEPHLNFNGNCEAAFRFYAECMSGKIETMLTWGNSPMASNVPIERHGEICHASMLIGESVLAGVDNPFTTGENLMGFQLILQLDDAKEARRIFDALADGGSVAVPLAEAFWTEGFGVVKDRFGLTWEINLTKPA